MTTLPKVEAFEADRAEDFEPDPDGAGDYGCDDGYA